MGRPLSVGLEALSGLRGKLWAMGTDGAESQDLQLSSLERLSDGSGDCCVLMSVQRGGA